MQSRIPRLNLSALAGTVSIHVKESQATWVSVLPLLLLMVRFKVTTESQPAALVNVCVAVLLFEV